MTRHADILHDSKLAIARRVVAQLHGAPPDWGPHAAAQDVAAYTDPARHAAELKILFRETPLVACLSADLPGSGSFRTFNDTGVPIFIVRGGNGQLRAFLNICPHRGASVVRQAEGCAHRFTCHFHGWTFTEDGRLAGVPQKQGFAGCTADRTLTELPVAERHGIVFVQATPTPDIDFVGRVDKLLGPFGAELGMLELSRATRVKTGTLPVAANWKYALDTYGEAYHFATLHRDTLAPHFSADAQIYDHFAPHHRILWPSSLMETWRDQPESDWDVDSLGAVHYIFPNTILFTGSTQPGRGYVTLFRHFPGATPGETVTHKSIYAPTGVKSEEHRAEIEAAYDATAHVVIHEDYVVAAEGYANLTSLPPGATVLYGRQEVAVQNVQTALAEAVGWPAPRRVGAGAAGPAKAAEAA